jgi:hypothetical protein
MNTDQMVKQAYLLGRFDTICEGGLRFISPQAKMAAQDHFVKTGELKVAYVDPNQAMQLMGGGQMPMDPSMGGQMGGSQMPPQATVMPGGNPAPMPQQQMGGMPPPSPDGQPSQGEVLMLGSQISNSDIKSFEKIVNILKGLKMQYDEQAAAMGGGTQPQQ